MEPDDKRAHMLRLRRLTIIMGFAVAVEVAAFAYVLAYPPPLPPQYWSPSPDELAKMPPIVPVKPYVPKER